MGSAGVDRAAGRRLAGLVPDGLLLELESRGVDAEPRVTPPHEGAQVTRPQGEHRDARRKSGGGQEGGPPRRRGGRPVLGGRRRLHRQL